MKTIYPDNPIYNFSEWRRWLKEERLKRLKLRNDEYKKGN